MSNMQGGRQLPLWFCAVLFITFGLFFLGVFEADLLETTQWLLSHHQTKYMPLLSPLIIVGLLLLLSYALNRVLKIRHSLYALNYAPAFWLIALATSSSLPMVDAASNGWGRIGFTAWGIIIAVGLWSVRHLFPARHSLRHPSTPYILLSNLCIMVSMMLITVKASNTRIDLHMALEMSRLARADQYTELLKTGRQTSHCTRSISAMRALALSKEGILPEKLFAYPQRHGAAGLIPLKADSSYVFDWPDALYHHLGSVCRNDVTCGAQAVKYLERVLQRHPGQIQADYLLCAYLLERHLDDFARTLPLHYAINDSLPRHYKEALVIYQRRNQPPLFQFHDDETEANLAGFLKLKTCHQDAREQEYNLYNMYSETYWCYYFCSQKQDK